MTLRLRLAVACICFGLAACEAPKTIELDREPGAEGEGEGEEGVVGIDDVVAAWDEVACGLYACAHRTRVTDDICALAADAHGAPAGTIRFASDTIAAGRGTFDVVTGAACLAVIASMDGFVDDCFGENADTFAAAFGEAFAASCGALVVGVVEEDAACVDDSECADGLQCLRDSEFEGCARSCRPRLAVNDSCVEHRADCDDDGVCNGEVCVARALTATGGQCFNHDECVSQRCYDFVCQEKSVRDGECVEEGDCQFGQFCRPLPPSTGLQGVCQDHAAAGEACGFAVRCSGNQACAGFSIKHSGGNQDGVCQAVIADVGDACVPVAAGFDDGDTGCYADLVCDADTSTCVVAPLLGAACGVDDVCGFNAFCDDGVCALKKRVGEPATTAAACEDPVYFNEFAQVCGDDDDNRCLAAF